jgi:hypothetical protein
MRAVRFPSPTWLYFCRSIEAAFNKNLSILLTAGGLQPFSATMQLAYLDHTYMQLYILVDYILALEP